MKSAPPSELDALWARLFFIQLGLFTLFLFGGICINWGIAIFKALGWFEAEIDFWNISQYSWPLILVLIAPIGWAIFGYYYAIRRGMIVFYESVLKHWNKQWARSIAAQLWGFFQKNKGDAIVQDNLAGGLDLMSREFQRLPKLIVWVAKKIIGKLPLLHLITDMDNPDFRKADQIVIQDQVETKLNEFAEECIGNALPKALYLVFVVNLIVLIWILFV